MSRIELISTSNKIVINPDQSVSVVSVGSLGPRGYQGDQGDQGIKGDQGDQGPPGTEPPTGMVSPFAGSSAPSSWLLCDGSAVSRTTYSNLFSVIGTTYGSGDGTTTFDLPDLTNRGVMGKGSGAFANLGDTGGAEDHTLTEAEMPSHDHGSGTLKAMRRAYGGTNNNSAASSATNQSTAIHDIPINGSTSSTGSGNAHNILDPFLTLNFIIKI